MSQEILILVGLFLVLIALAILIPLFYKIFTGKSANTACKSIAAQFSIKPLIFVPYVQFSPFSPLCDIFAPF